MAKNTSDWIKLLPLTRLIMDSFPNLIKTYSQDESIIPSIRFPYSRGEVLIHRFHEIRLENSLKCITSLVFILLRFPLFPFYYCYQFSLINNN